MNVLLLSNPNNRKYRVIKGKFKGKFKEKSKISYIRLINKLNQAGFAAY